MSFKISPCGKSFTSNSFINVSCAHPTILQLSIWEPFPVIIRNSFQCSFVSNSAFSKKLPFRVLLGIPSEVILRNSILEILHKLFPGLPLGVRRLILPEFLPQFSRNFVQVVISEFRPKFLLVIVIEFHPEFFRKCPSDYLQKFRYSSGAPLGFSSEISS